jgi:hypothetical protein
MLSSDAFSFEGTGHRQTPQGIKQSNYGSLVVNSSTKRPLSTESTALHGILSSTL